MSFPGGLQLGGGVTDANAARYLDAGASHVIVTSHVFREGRLDEARLKELVRRWPMLLRLTDVQPLQASLAWHAGQPGWQAALGAGPELQRTGWQVLGCHRSMAALQRGVLLLAAARLLAYASVSWLSSMTGQGMQDPPQQVATMQSDHMWWPKQAPVSESMSGAACCGACYVGHAGSLLL